MLVLGSGPLAAEDVAGDAATPAAAPARSAAVPETFGSSDIRDWYAPDNETIVITTYAHGSFMGTFMGRCTGIRFAETLGFRTRGPNELDTSTVIVLPDGRRCALRALVPLSDEEERAARARR